MKKMVNLKRFLVLGLSISVAFAASGEDWEYWSHFESGRKITDQISYRIAPEFRFKNNARDHYYRHFEIMLDMKVTNWLTLSPSYRHVQTLAGIQWITEKRPQFDATFKGKVIGVDGSDRSRLEYRLRDDNTTYRYRNKLTFKKTTGLTALRIQPFLANELFYVFDVDKLNKNRFYTGIDFALTTTVKGSIQYLRESTLKNDEWNHFNVFGTALKFNF